MSNQIVLLVNSLPKGPIMSDDTSDENIEPQVVPEFRPYHYEAKGKYPERKFSKMDFSDECFDSQNLFVRAILPVGY